MVAEHRGEGSWSVQPVCTMLNHPKPEKMLVHAGHLRAPDLERNPTKERTDMDRKEQEQVVKGHILRLIKGTDIPREEMEDCVNRFIGYLCEVILKTIKREKFPEEQVPELCRFAMIGFVGGYASRNLYAARKRKEFAKG